MTLYLFIALLAVSISNNFCRKVEIQCPARCKCDLFENYRRAECINKTLVVFQAHLPKQTEILDLSYNQISDLTKNIFIEADLLSLKLLNISHNKVSQIHLNTFTQLDELKTLDLSYNALQYLIPLWFSDLKHLEEIYLSHNHFDKFTEPIFQSATVKRLDLSYCFVSYVANEAFERINNLEYLDLTGNNIIQIDVGIISKLNNLQVLKLLNNPISCNDNSITISKYCLKNGIRYENPCRKITKNDNKFERIVMSEPEEEKNSWIYDDEETKNVTTSIEVCSNRTAKDDESLLMEIINLSPTLSILITFAYGIAIGILIGCSVQIRSRKKRSDEDQDDAVPFKRNRRSSRIFNSRPQLSLSRSNSLFSRKTSRDDDLCDSLVLQECTNIETTPIPTRKSCS